MLDLQTPVEYITAVATAITPIVCIFVIVQKTTNMFIDFVNGNRRVRL